MMLEACVDSLSARGRNIKSSKNNPLDDSREPHAFNDKDEWSHLLSEIHMHASADTVGHSLLSLAITPNETARGQCGNVMK